MGVIACLASLCYIVYGAQSAGSALLGGLVYLIPNVCFAMVLFKHQGARASRRIVNSFYKGEALKIGLSIALFIMVFVLFRVKPGAFFASYIVLQMTHWFAPLIIENNRNRPESD